jgi:LPS O-antigen subunit length determinant protein (WzzB/FepE family)
MDTAIIAVLISIGCGVVIAVIGYLFSQRDKDREAAIIDLYEKHKIDAQELIDLRLLVAKKYYDSEETDKLLSTFKDHFDQRFDRVEKLLEK